MTVDRKHLEREHYDQKAGDPAALLAAHVLDLHGPAAIEPHLRAPYAHYAAAIEARLPDVSTVLELGAGTGVHSLLAARPGITPIASDLSQAALRVARARADRADVRIDLVVADAETLPIASASIDLVTSAGVLYCLDLEHVLSEIQRVLAPSGSWIFVDSFDHNPIYRLNRLVGWLRGRRTHRAFTQIPTERTLASIRARFREVTVAHFGVWSFAWPVLHRLVGADRAAAILNRLEPARRLGRFAFKIVVVARGPVVSTPRHIPSAS